MKSEELKNKNKAELSEILSNLRLQLAKLGFELEASTLKDTSQIKKTKKDIARVLHMLNSDTNYERHTNVAT